MDRYADNDRLTNKKKTLNRFTYHVIEFKFLNSDVKLAAESKNFKTIS